MAESCRRYVAEITKSLASEGNLTVDDVRLTLLGLRDRGLVEMRKAGFRWLVTAPTIDDLHAEALEEDRERFPISGNDGDLTADEHEKFLEELREDVRKNGPTPRWQDGIPQVDTSWRRVPGPLGDVRCSETGVEVRQVHGGQIWEVLFPEWQQGRKVMRMARILGSKTESLGWACRVTRPLMRERIAHDHAHAKLLNASRINWAPEHSAKLAADTRPAILTMMPTGSGSLVAAAEIVDRVVKRARYDALRAVLAEIDGWGIVADDIEPQFTGDDFRDLLNRAARKLGVPEAWKP